MDGEAVVRVDALVRFYRYDPAGMDKGVDCLHATDSRDSCERRSIAEASGQ
jgi:hypothetical protein